MNINRPVRVLACAGGLLLAGAAPAEGRMPIEYAAQLSAWAKDFGHRHVSHRARLTRHGRAIAPAGAPKAVRRIIRAGNRIAHKPYVWGGGHGGWLAAGYDCSGSVSYALHGASLLEQAEASGGLTAFGKAGKGRWVTIYANGGHAYLVVAGLRFDTTAFKQTGSRWTRDLRGGDGFVVRHPRGL